MLLAIANYDKALGVNPKNATVLDNKGLDAIDGKLKALSNLNQIE
jgi:hypothetical protein